jgi:hypothetical protein
MKTQSSSALQFSGYPFRVIEDNVSYPEAKPYLKVAIKNEQKANSSLVANPAVNNPQNWDNDWFGNYE